MASSSPCLATLFLFIIFSLLSPSESAEPEMCSMQGIAGKKVYTFCVDLPSLMAYLYWNYDLATSTLSIAFIAPLGRANGWVSWAINPVTTGMVGSSALIAFKDAGGAMTVKTYNVSSYGRLEESSKVWYEVKDLSAEYSGGTFKIYATLVLPEKWRTVNHVWQVGRSVTHGVPDKHRLKAENLNAKGSLDLLAGENRRTDVSRTIDRNFHGAVNLLSWGILFPVGIMIARYLRAFPSADPTWFYLHASCQVLAYVMGVAGWGTGLKLGNQSHGVTRHFHRYAGTTLFVLATLQMTALFLRPHKDSKCRFYWNIYHRICGYLLHILGIFNVYVGLYWLRYPKWIMSYTVVILVLVVIALVLELLTCIIVRRREKVTAPVSMRALDGVDHTL